MSWWSGLDDDIYLTLDEVKARAAGAEAGPDGPAPSAAPSPAPRIPGPTAILARQVATPNYELLWFARQARRHGFRPLVIEHAGDRFTVHNPTKRALATLPVVVGRSRDGRAILRRQRIVEPEAAEGRRLDAVLTRTGERLLDYHHRKLRAVMGPAAPQVVDLRDVLPEEATRPARYYVEFFKLLSGGAVLFEDFVADEQTAGFFQGTVLPAWREAVAQTGRRPQIVRLGPGKRTSSPRWIAYPPAMADDPAWLRNPARAPRAPAALDAAAPG